MGTQLRFLRNTYLRLVDMGSVHVCLYPKLILFAGFFWASVSTLFLALFGFLKKTVFRGKEYKSSRSSNSDCCVEFDSISMEKEAEVKEQEVEVTEFKVTEEIDELEEKESPKFFFKFQYQTYREEDESVGSDSVPLTSTNKYEFLKGKDSSHYMEEPEVVSLTVEELYANTNDDFSGNKENTDKNFLSHEEFTERKGKEEEMKKLEADTFMEVETKNLENAGVREKFEAEIFIEKSVSERRKVVVDVENIPADEQDVSRDDGKFLSEKECIESNSDSDSITSSHEFVRRFLASTSDDFLSDKDFEDTFEFHFSRGIGHDEKAESTYDEEFELEYLNLQNPSTGYEADDFDEEDSDIMEELKKIEKESNMPERVVEQDFPEDNKSKSEEPKDNSDSPEKLNPENPSTLDSSEDSSGLETEWEHQDLIEQLKMELKKVRATGLPTILEDDESPKIMEDLKPWKIDEKFHHVDKMGELHKFYKSYRERMRKFDILNYQKMYAMGFLQSKDSLRSMPSEKASAPALTSLLSHKFLLSKRKKSGSDPMVNFMKELHGDLEMVYVGQMCLSWEILHWQYEKALELWDSDMYRTRRYNEVAGEFQQFQVLMQRFIENEPYEDPRVQNYTKKRCMLRNLLQVPVIREDSMKDKKARMKSKDDYTITSDRLVEIVEESIRIFWRFVRADKDTQNVIQKGSKGTQIEPQDPTELELLTKVRTNLQTKEKKLKDILRSGNCILKKFQKHQEESSVDRVLYFFSQVDMKLVARVLNMSKITTDQLIWCDSKLSNISFVSRKIHLEPSFSLFPCS